MNPLDLARDYRDQLYRALLDSPSFPAPSDQRRLDDLNNYLADNGALYS